MDPREEAAENEFEQGVDDATDAVITEFFFLGLPDGEQLCELTSEVNAALTAIFAEWK